jgi:hypothetical protein
MNLHCEKRLLMESQLCPPREYTSVVDFRKFVETRRRAPARMFNSIHRILPGPGTAGIAGSFLLAGIKHAFVHFRDATIKE